jgi:DNA-binding MarR family transcriptional regulator
VAESSKPSAATRESRFEPKVPGVAYGVLDELVGYALRRAQIKLYEDFVDSLSTWDVTPQRFAALVIIAENPDLKLTELARVMGVARSGAVALVDFLAERGYVARLDSPTDKRAFQLRITASGKRALAAMTEAVRDHDARIVGMLTNADQGQLMGLLRRMVGL